VPIGNSRTEASKRTLIRFRGWRASARRSARGAATFAMPSALATRRFPSRSTRRCRPRTSITSATCCAASWVGDRVSDPPHRKPAWPW